MASSGIGGHCRLILRRFTGTRRLFLFIAAVIAAVYLIHAVVFSTSGNDTDTNVAKPLKPLAFPLPGKANSGGAESNKNPINAEENAQRLEKSGLRRNS